MAIERKAHRGRVLDTQLKSNKMNKGDPIWLKPMLEADYFVPCAVHGHSNKSECNFYCIDCKGNALCSYCLKHHNQHRNHRILQIRRSSYHDVIRVNEIQKHIDISGIQTYVINSAKIVFLNERPQLRPGKGVSNACDICCRTLHDDSFRFCSLGCKLEGVNRGDVHVTFRLPWELSRGNEFVTNSEFEVSASSSASTSSSTLKRVRLSEWDGDEEDFSPTTPPITNYRKGRRRKGIPHRAPF